MAITAKIITLQGHVNSIQLPDAPSDLDLMTALGGNEDNYISQFGSLAGFDAIRINGGANTLIVGSASYMVNGSRDRVSCNWPDDKVVKIVKHLEKGYREFGFA